VSSPTDGVSQCPKDYEGQANHQHDDDDGEAATFRGEMSAQTAFVEPTLSKVNSTLHPFVSERR